MPFFKTYSEGILRGSLAYEDNTIQLIWIKLLAMANETRDRDGYLRYSEGHPYSKKYIVQTCHVTDKELDKALKAFKNDIRDNVPRILIAKDGSIFISNFKKYQDKPIKERKLMPQSQRNGMQTRLNTENPEHAMDDLNNQGYGTFKKVTGEIVKE